VNGTSYPIEIRAVNSIGNSAASTTVDVAPASVPTAPAVTLTPGDGAISVGATFSNNGGSPDQRSRLLTRRWPIHLGRHTRLEFLRSPDSRTATTYTVAVRADNASGREHRLHRSTRPRLPSRGRRRTCSPGVDSASTDVTWVAPLTNGGSAITGYTATAYTA